MDLVGTLSFVALYGLSYGMVLFIISVGLAVVMGLMRVINLAHGAFAAIGGYLAVSLMSDWSLPFGLAVIVAALVVAAASVPIERVFYVKLYRAGELEQVLLTMGLIFVAVAGLNLFFGPNPIKSGLPESLSASVDLGVRRIELYRLVVIAVGLILMVALWLLFERTAFGARLRAAVDNRGMAQAVGINVDRLFSYAFALGSGLAAFGGALGFQILPLEPMYPLKYLALFLIVVSLAGFGNIRGAALMALFVGVVETASRLLWPELGAFVVYFILIGLLLWRHRPAVLARA
jgi:branched-chain amino acid transport system permease protein